MGRKRKYFDCAGALRDIQSRTTADGSGGGESESDCSNAPTVVTETEVNSSGVIGSTAEAEAKLSKQFPVQRNAANERERARMRVLSKAFARLKTSLPWVPADTKLSKLDTLRLASCYIAHLSQLLQSEDDEESAVITETSRQALQREAVEEAAVGRVADSVNKNASISSTTSTASNTSIHPVKMSWPFTFNNRHSLGSLVSSSFSLCSSASEIRPQRSNQKYSAPKVETTAN